jgi:hypothetical protein
MNEHLYRVENVREVLHPFFEQLDQEFGKKYEIWVQEHNFGRSISAGVVNRNTGNAVTIKIQDNAHVRSYPLQQSEIEKIHDHLASNGSMKDLSF